MTTSDGNQGKTAEFLDQFEKSPYSYPANDRQIVQGASAKKGSWKAK